MNLARVTTLPPPPARPDEAHKGIFGRVLIVAGSRGMSGAACLTGLGALRGGAGLVYLAVPAGILSIVAGTESSYLTIPLSEDDQGRIDYQSHTMIEQVAPRNTAAAMGPGWGLSDDLVQLARWLYTTLDLPSIFDADALNALSVAGELPEARSGRILTPHPGEFARLLNTDVRSVQENREEAAAEFARKHGVVLLLKGHHTVITDGKRIAINPTGNSGMATGGSGDVLTGVISALVAQNMPPFEAAQLGAYLHGLAGDLAVEQYSKPGLIASDLPQFLGRAWKSLDA